MKRLLSVTMILLSLSTSFTVFAQEGDIRTDDERATVILREVVAKPLSKLELVVKLCLPVFQDKYPPLQKIISFDLKDLKNEDFDETVDFVHRGANYSFKLEGNIWKFPREKNRLGVTATIKNADDSIQDYINVTVDTEKILMINTSPMEWTACTQASALETPVVKLGLNLK